MGERDSVSLITLIARPEAFERREIQVAGYFSISDDGETALFVSENDYRHNLRKNAIRVYLRPEVLDKRTIYDGKYVSIRGVFTAEYAYRDILYSGAITNLIFIGLQPEMGGQSPGDLQEMFFAE